ncbi:TetR/AcrR family transcriptional regulator [Actinomadura darangshiensis]|uniref:TetR/AcrR family transcriptional regulator n=1 Tax=Actinomadura darangshiensis TaxID=705336 RepID=A0A4R5BSS2_9ACTN|nr:TetR/AcrR family transcriptional regulator [Actinomadura darangshiensis]TDD88513.1 TetR/AcrR family transcriptional regulator [Actinomadura darangshiensis]
MAAGTNTARTRVARRDWIEAAYRELARGGERGVAITALAARLGVTKGSFYWHFKDRTELMRALLDRWAHERTDEVLGLALGSTADPRERLRRIQALGREVAPIDRAMRLWAQHEPAADEAVRHADRALLGHIAACLAGLGFGEEDARLRALLMLRTWAGGYLVPGTGDPEPPDRMLEIFLAG